MIYNVAGDGSVVLAAARVGKVPWTSLKLALSIVRRALITSAVNPVFV